MTGQERAEIVEKLATIEGDVRTMGAELSGQIETLTARVNAHMEKTTSETKTLFASRREHAGQIADIRADYVWKRYDHDKMDRDKVDYSYVRLGEQEAIRMAGYWYNDKATAGGYFQTYYVYDEEEKLLWAVDCLVYAPGRPKHELVRELRCIAETFRTN